MVIGAVSLHVSAAEKLTIKAFRNGDYAQRSAPVFRSTADGKHYTAITPNGRAIVKYQYSNGAAVDTLMTLDKVRNDEKIDVQHLKLAGYELSQDEERLLVYANPESIYRRSFKADYFYYVI